MCTLIFIYLFWPYLWEDPIKYFLTAFLATCSLILFAMFVFYSPNVLGHADNYIEANPLVTPAHIVPEWYLLPFYAILRSVPDKLLGVVAMLSAILIFALDINRLYWKNQDENIFGSVSYENEKYFENFEIQVLV